MALSPLLLLGLALGAAAPSPATAAAPPQAAVMPLGGGDWMLPSAREALENNLRSAVEALGLTVQPLAETLAYIDEGASAGLDCSLLSDDCALRVGLIANVDSVVTAAVEQVDDRLLVRGSWLAVDADARRHLAGEIKMPIVDGGRSLKAIVARLVTGEGEIAPLPFSLVVQPVTATVTVDGEPLGPTRLWLMPGPHTLHAEAKGKTTVDRVFHVSLDGIDNGLIVELPNAEVPPELYFGVGVAGVGGAMALTAAVVTTVIEAQLQAGNVKHADREGRQRAGRIAAGAGLIGVVMIGGGTAIAIMESPR